MGTYRIEGAKVTTQQLGSGRWNASSGYGSETADTESAARVAIGKTIRAAKREDDKRYAEQAAASDAKRAKRAGKECTLAYCSGALDSPAHRKSAKHRNAEAVERSRHANDRF